MNAMAQTGSAAKKPERAQDAIANGGEQQGSPLVELVNVKDGSLPPKRPRQEKGMANKKTCRGNPVQLCQLNLDVLFLIATHIQLLDLLNLARTCKSLRGLLMHSSSAFVWKTTRQQVKGLPPCPDDLTEPEYANLVVYNRCHGCDKYTAIIMWKVRRRYCPSCRVRRLRPLSSCDEVIRVNKVLPTELIHVKKKSSVQVDGDQAAEFMEEYRRSSDKAQFIIERQEQRKAILRHARKCRVWQKQRDSDLKEDRKRRQLMRRQSIFRRLDEQGYSREIDYFGHDDLQRHRESDFRSLKPLTDRGWKEMLPPWVKLMKELRWERLDKTVYAARRREFKRAYSRYVEQPLPDAPTIELLPDVLDLVRFPRFREMIRAPEEIVVNDKSFTLAFKELPILVAEWKKKLDAELAELVKIPPQLCPANVPKRQSSDAGTDKLRLACAVFRTHMSGPYDHLEVFSVSRSHRAFVFDESRKPPRSIKQHFGIQFMEEAPFIVQACGLDPSVATVGDMDDRNAQLKCLSCEGGDLIMNWRHAMLHASQHIRFSSLSDQRSEPLRWQLISDGRIDAIQPAEQSSMVSVRCSLCIPSVGDEMMSPYAASRHMSTCHGIKRAEPKHLAPIGLYPRSAVELVEERGAVSFRALSKQG